jgi:hypothetical protein
LYCATLVLHIFFCVTQRLVIWSFFTRVSLQLFVNNPCLHKHRRAMVDLTSIGPLSITRLTVQMNINILAQ